MEKLPPSGWITSRTCSGDDATASRESWDKLSFFQHGLRFRLTDERLVIGRSSMATTILSICSPAAPASSAIIHDATLPFAVTNDYLCSAAPLARGGCGIPKD